MDSFRTNFCSNCSLKKPEIPYCDDNLYTNRIFFDFEHFMKEKTAKGQDPRCDLLFWRDKRIVFIEQKALNWFINKTQTSKDITENIPSLRKKLKKKLFFSIKNLDYYKDISICSLSCLVVFSKDVIRFPKQRQYDLVWLKYYLQNRLFYGEDGLLSYRGRDIPIFARSCNQIEDLI